jgi:hypothetical protein
VAKKARTPPPPRRPVQAPRTRTGAGRAADRRRFLVPAALAGLGLVALIVVGALFAFGGDNDSGSGPSALREAGCTLQAFPAQSRDHVQELPEDFKYNSSPPTSGPHHPQPAPFDVYEEPVEQFRLVHNLEHGGVVIQYGRRVPEQTVNQIVDWYRDEPNGIVIAPLPSLGNTIALAAWTAEVDASGAAEGRGEGILAKCERFDEKAFDSFMDEFAFRGPERFPEDQLSPGL